MLLVHKIALKPNQAQQTYFAKACGIARFAYHWALAEWERDYAAGGKPNEAALRRKLNAIKGEQFPWMLEVSKRAPQQAIKNLGSAFKHFFRRCKQGEKKKGYPRFKKKGIHDSFRVDNGPPTPGENAVRIDAQHIQIPRLGWVRMCAVLRFQGQVKSVVIARTANRWFAAIVVDTQAIPLTARKNPGGAIGVDLGIKRLATLSHGEAVPGPKAPTALLHRLKKLSRRLSKKTNLTSHNRKKAKQKLTQLQARIANIRNDALHKLTTRLALEFDDIGIEDLNVKGMASNRCLARPIMEAGFYELRRQLKYKAARYGAKVHVADRRYPSSKQCSACYVINTALTLQQRAWTCPSCAVRDRFEICPCVEDISVSHES
jgi:transposase, IS605 OrfB family, central region